MMFQPWNGAGEKVACPLCPVWWINMQFIRISVQYPDSRMAVGSDDLTRTRLLLIL